MLFGEIVGLYF